MVMAWPNRIKDADGIRTQFHHFIDIVRRSSKPPAFRREDAERSWSETIEGVSMAYTFDNANANTLPLTRHSISRCSATGDLP